MIKYKKRKSEEGIRFKNKDEILDYLNKIKKSSNCALHTSCVIVDRNNNYVVHGVDYHPNYSGKVKHRNKDTYEFREGKPRSTHAEADAIIKYLSGEIREDAVLYSSHMPCSGCAELIKRAGIKRVRYFSEFDNDYGKLILQTAGIDIRKAG